MIEALTTSLVLLAIAVVAWACYFESMFKPVRYVLFTVLGLVSLIFCFLAWIILANPFGNLKPMMLGLPMQPFGYGFLAIGLTPLICMMPTCRQWIQRSRVFTGFEADNLVHSWALFIYAVVVVLSVITLVIFKPEQFVDSLRAMPLHIMAMLNAMDFMVFAFVASGLWHPALTNDGRFKAVAQRLGLGPVSLKTLGLMLGSALVLALFFQVVEPAMIRTLDPDMQQSLQKMGMAIMPAQGLGATLGVGLIIGFSAGVGEEVLFRGLMQPVFGVIPAAILFALIHSHYGFTPILVLLGLLGAICGVVRIRFNTTAAILLHGAFDFFSILLSYLQSPH